MPRLRNSLETRTWPKNRLLQNKSGDRLRRLFHTALDVGLAAVASISASTPPASTPA